MTHFTRHSVRLFCGLLVLTAHAIDLRGLLAGIGISALMLSPYLAFEAIPILLT